MQVRGCVLLCALTLPIVIPNAAAADSGFTCPVTVPPDPAFVPPAPFPASLHAGTFWYGTRELWTLLPTNGVWNMDRTDRGYVNKLFLWKEGYNGLKDLKPDIIVVLSRLDAQLPLVASRGGTNAFFADSWHMLVGVGFPTEGC